MKTLRIHYPVCLLCTVLALLTLFALAGGAVAEESGTCGKDLTWTLQNDTLTISGNGEMQDYEYIEVSQDVSGIHTIVFPWDQILEMPYTTAPWGELHFSRVIVEEGVTRIGAYAFYGCLGLTDVSLPDSLVALGSEAFGGCFYLSTIKLPDSLTTIGEGAFNFMGFMATEEEGRPVEITLPNSMTSIDESAFFYSCIESIILPDSITSIGEKAFEGCDYLSYIVLPDSVTSIGEKAFADCRNLINIALPESLVFIGEQAFDEAVALTVAEGSYAEEYCKSHGYRYYAYEDGIMVANSAPISLKLDENGTLTVSGTGKLNRDIIEVYDVETGNTVLRSWKEAIVHVSHVIVEEGITSVEDNVFEKSSITDVTLPDSIRSIGFAAFSECRALKNVNLPNDLPEAVISIGDQAFEGCTGLTEVYLPPAVSNIWFNAFPDSTTLSVIKGSYAEEYCLVNRHAMRYADGVLPEGYTFAHLRWWVLDENGVLSIFGTGKMEDLALNWAMAPWYESKDKIVRVVINEGITNIAPRAFSGCSNLTEITIPQSVTVIGRYAFLGCQKLQSIDLHAGITSIEESVFDYCPISKVTVEKGSYAERYCVYRNIPVMHKGEKKASVISQDKYRMCGENLKWSVNNGTLTISGEGEMDDLEEWCYVNAAKAYRPSFWGKSKFSGVDMKPGITNIVDCAFYDRSDLKKVTLPDTVTSIGKKAFQGCGLQEIILPDSIVSIGELAFGECSLQSVILPGNLASIDRSAFTSCTHLKEIELPESLTAIGEYAFSYCTHLKTINLPNSITSIGADAFTGCYSLTIYVDKGSYAETYCKENGLSFSYTE